MLLSGIGQLNIDPRPLQTANRRKDFIRPAAIDSESPYYKRLIGMADQPVSASCCN